MISKAPPFLSARVAGNIEASSSMDRLIRVMENLYDPVENPTGVINLSVAENVSMGALMYTELTEFLNARFSVDAFSCTYGHGPSGTIHLRSALAAFLTTRFRALTPVLPAHIVVSSGLTCTAEMVAYTLANPGDGILVGRPLYSAFANDFYARSKVSVVGVAFGGESPFAKSCVGFYEQALREWNERPGESRVRALVIVNPHNPLGQCYEKETLVELMKFCGRHGIHLISDEIYALSSFENPDAPDAPVFTSILSVENDGHIDPSLVHVMYGMSKDFSANGFRLGAFISQNSPQVIKGLESIANFTWPSALSDKAWTAVLKDTEFLDGYISLNTKRLGETYVRCTEILKTHGIKYQGQGNAALFLWLDLSEYLPVGLEVWEAERVLADRICSGGVFLASGSDFSSEKPGRFRVVFSMVHVELGLRRLVKVLEKKP